jgi:hypothetical protein
VNHLLEDRPGIVRVVGTGRSRRPVAPCLRCEREMPVSSRGLCRTCTRASTDDGTLADYPARMETQLELFAGYRRAGHSPGDAAGLLGVSGRQAQRYESRCREMGAADWLGRP